MDSTLTLTQIFFIGLASTLHCLGMCGGIVGALSLSLPDEVRSNRSRLFLFVSLMNIGRIVSYMAAGLVAGAFGLEILKALGLDNAHQILKYVGVVFMVAIGFYLAGWFPQMARVEKIGQPVWKILQPVVRKMMPINSSGRALVYGMAWGWLPCGLVYVVLLSTITAGSAVQGASMMLAFGLGTLPTMISAGFMASWLRRFASSVQTRRIIGILIVIMAIASLYLGAGYDEHQHHQH